MVRSVLVRSHLWGLIVLVVALGAGAPRVAAQGQRVELTVWSNITVKSQADVIARHVNECLAGMSGVTAKFDTVSFDAMYPRLITALEQGKLPNIMNTSEGATAFLQAKGGLVPVDDLIDALGRKDFIESYLHAMSRDGKTWALPDWALHQEVWYRTDLFKERGIAIPRSWDELLQAAKTLTRDDVYGFAVPMGRVQVAAQTYFQILYSAHAYVFDPQTGAYAFGRQKDTAVKALQFMVDLYKAASPPASIDWQWAGYRTAFVKGQVAMTNEWGAVVSQALEQNPGMLDKMGVFPFPSPDSNREPGGAQGSGYYYIIGKAPAAEVDASKRVLKCMYEPRRVAERANSRPIFAVPATRSAYNSKTYQDHELVRRFKPQLDLIFTKVMPRWYRYGMEAGLHPLNAQIEATTFVADAIQNVALNRWTAQQAVDFIDQQLRFQVSLISGPGK
jgi:multiple sugar transport system substrate-binding protein